MTPLEIFTLLVGLLYLGGIYSVAITIPRVARHWKPVYWLGLATVAVKTAMFVLAFGRDVFEVRLPENTIRNLLLVSLAFVGLLFVLIPFVHRYEAKMLGPTSTGVGEEKPS